MIFLPSHFTPFRLLLIIWLSLLASGCTVKLIASYDKTTDDAVTALHRKVSTFLIDVESKLGTADSEYGNFSEIYKELRVDISAIELRVNAMPKNSITQSQIRTLKQSISDLEQLHQTGFANNLLGQQAVLAQAQDDFDRSLAAILKLELAKRRGAEPEE